MDRGEVSRLAVLCPPHLVEQWQGELLNRFNMQAIALTSASANCVGRDLPHGVGLFDHYPIVVVSLDYIKSERHREQFFKHRPRLTLPRSRPAMKVDDRPWVSATAFLAWSATGWLRGNPMSAWHFYLGFTGFL